MIPKVYWDEIVKEGNTYQMGAQSHRVYVLNLLSQKGVHTILDVGCGTAPIYELIHTKSLPEFLDYKGVDYSEGMIETAKKHFPLGKFEVQDGRNLKEPDNSWDCVLMMHSLDHINEYTKAIQEAARVSKKYVCIILWRPVAPKGEINMSGGMIKPDGTKWADTWLLDFTRDKLENAFKEAGLEIEFEKTHEDPKIIKKGKLNTSN